MKYTALALLAFASLSTTLAHATPISGSDSIAFFGVNVTPGGSPLDPEAGLTSINFTSAVTSNTGTGDLSSLGSGVTASGSTSFNPNTASGFTLTFGTYGTFTESSIQLVTESTVSGSSNLTVYMLGTFTPGTSLSAFTAGPASLDMAFTDTTNTTYSGSGTLASPPAAVNPTPEPSSLILLGSGLASAAGVAFRRRRNA